MVRHILFALLATFAFVACGADENELPDLGSDVPVFEPGNTGPFGGYDPRQFGPPSAAQELMLMLMGLPMGSSPDPVPAINGSSPDPVPAYDPACPGGRCSGAGRR